jgi:hypothetical protein
MYLFYRPPGHTVLLSWPLSRALLQAMPHSAVSPSWTDWLPSFIHVLAFSLLSAGALGMSSRGRFLVPVFWGAVNLLFELGQYARLSVQGLFPSAWPAPSLFAHLDGYFLSGVFDAKDLAAGVAGTLVAIFVLRAAGKTVEPLSVERPPSLRLRRVAGAAVALSGVACLLATGPYQECAYDPVYLSYSELRQPVAAGGPQALSKTGKIYVYGSVLLINEPNKGVHIVDNADPRAPVNLLFLSIPGNIDVAIKDNILYADSYIDLVAMDMSDMNNVREVSRVKGVFPYDPYQSISDTSVYICSYDETRGVVVGYERRRRQND